MFIFSKFSLLDFILHFIYISFLLFTLSFLLFLFCKTLIKACFYFSRRLWVLGNPSNSFASPLFIITHFWLLLISLWNLYIETNFANSSRFRMHFCLVCILRLVIFRLSQLYPALIQNFEFKGILPFKIILKFLISISSRLVNILVVFISYLSLFLNINIIIFAYNFCSNFILVYSLLLLLN